MATTLSTDEMKTFVRTHFEEFVDQKKPEVIRRNMTSDFLDHDGPGGAATDASGDEAMMRQLHALLPDLHVTTDALVAKGDSVVCRNRWHGTNARTGEAMELHGFVQWRFEGDKIAERWATVTPLQKVAPKP